MAVERYELLAHLADAVPEEALVLSTYIGAVSFEWGHLTDEHPRTGSSGRWATLSDWRPALPSLCPIGRSSASIPTDQCSWSSAR